MGVEEGAEPVKAHDQRMHGGDRLHRGSAVAGGFARHLADEITGTAQREDGLTAVIGHGEDLHPTVKQDEHVRRRITLHAHGRAWRISLVPAKSP